MLSRRHHPRTTRAACNDNGRLWSGRKSANLALGILDAASQSRRLLVLTYIADGVLIISSEGITVQNSPGTHPIDSGRNSRGIRRNRVATQG
jgi:hypothetical protein